MALRFFQIGKANEEIDRLAAELAKVTSERDALQGNDSTIAAEAEKVKGELAAANAKAVQLDADLATAKQTISTLTEGKAKAEADLKAAQESIADPAGTIQKLAAVKAQEIAAGQGIPIKQLPAPGADSKQETLESVREAMAKETDPVKKSALAQRARELRGHGSLFKEPTQ